MSEVWMHGAVETLLNLKDDGTYLADIQSRLRAAYGTADETELSAKAPIELFAVGRATHSSQDGYDWTRLRRLLEGPATGAPHHARSDDVPLLVYDVQRDQIMVYDGNHRYAAAFLRGHSAIRVRMLTLIRCTAPPPIEPKAAA